MPITAKEHREKRAALIQKAQAFNTEHEDDKGNLSAEHEATFSEMMADAAAHLKSAKRLESLESASASLDDPTTVTTHHTIHTAIDDQPTKQTISLRQGFGESGSPTYADVDHKPTSYLQFGIGQDGKVAVNTITPDRAAALQTDDASQAGYLVTPEQLASGILKTVDDLLFIRQHAKVHTRLTAQSLGIRKRTARLSSFAWGTELKAPTADTALAYGKKVLTPHYATGSILVSNDLMRNAAESIEAEVRSEMARDAGEGLEDAYLLGHSAQQPLGVFVASSDGISTSRDVVTGSATGFTADGLLSAKYELKSQYRNGTRGGARWMFHRDGIELIAKLKDSNNQYLFRVGMGRAQDNSAPEDMLLGFPVDESERCPNTFTTGLYVGMLCNWSYYEIADSLDMEIEVLRELNARTNQTEFLYRLKTDGMPTLEEAFVRLKTS